MNQKKSTLIRKILLVLWCVVIPALVLASAIFQKLDSALEIDDLKSQIRLQREDMRFLLALLKTENEPCHLTLDRLQNVASEMRIGYAAGLEKNEGRVGSFSFSTVSNCAKDLQLTAYR